MKHLFYMSTAVVVVAVSLFVTAVYAEDLYVPMDFLTIQEAVDYAVDGDQVLVLEGTYSGYGNTNVDLLGKAIRVASLSGPDITVIDCRGSGHGFVFMSGENTETEIEGFTIRNGSMPNGGAIYCESSSPRIADCIMTDNEANYGGAVYCMNSSPEFMECNVSYNEAMFDGGGFYFDGTSSGIVSVSTIKNNSADGWGGGIALHKSSPSISSNTIELNTAMRGGGISCHLASPSIISSNIRKNTADALGGGIYCLDASPGVGSTTIEDNVSNSDGGGVYAHNSSSPNFTDCTVSGNHCWSSGGGFTIFLASASISRCTISDNDASGYSQASGGGVFCNQSSITMTNCTVVGNTSSGIYSNGGGLYFETMSYPVIKHCTIADNETDSDGGGIYCFYYSNPEIVDCIIWNNSPNSIAQGLSTIGVTYSDVEGGWTGTGNINSYPYFSGSGDYHLTAWSPCIDSGVDTGVDIDIDHDTRPLGGGYDMGSDEFVPEPPELDLVLSGYPETIGTGETLVFDATVTNEGDSPQAFDKALMSITGPASVQKTIYNGGTFFLDPGESVSATISQYVPGNAPGGFYNVEVSIYLNGVELDSDSFDIEVEVQ